MNLLWKRWVKVTKRIASLLADTVLILIYFLFIVPLSVLLRTQFSKLLLGHSHNKKLNSYWILKRAVKQNLKWAREQ